MPSPDARAGVGQAGSQHHAEFRSGKQFTLCPVTLDEDAGVIDGEDVAAEEGPAGGCRAGPLCACWRGDGQSDVTSVMAIRALAWSTMALRSA